MKMASNGDVQDVGENLDEKNREDIEETERMLNADEFEDEVDLFCKDMAITKDTSCGFWIFQGKALQTLANKKMFVLIYGLGGLFFGSSFAYFTGTITTMEKRFKITSKTTGIISVGNDITQLLAAVFLSYYAGRGHRPRWIAFGLYCVAAFCFLTALPHLIYGPGEDALQLTFEHGDYVRNMTTNMTQHMLNKHLCGSEGNDQCDLGEASTVPVIIWFIAQLVSGIGGALYYSLGFSYMDDNIKKSKSPVIISFTYFIRMLGPTFGFCLVSIFLKMYIAPGLTPTIDNSDPRWLGAWWVGWFILGVLQLFFASLLALLPKTLPRAAARKELLRLKNKESTDDDSAKPSFKGMMESVQRLMSNSIYNYNQLSSIFYVFGYNPYWVFLPKYIEIQYRQSASVSSLVTGVVGLVFSALGVLVSGIVVQRFKPRARYMAFWNMVVGLVSLLGIIGYSMLGCSAVDEQHPVMPKTSDNSSCSSDCRCDFVKFSPVCSIDGTQTFISACHAGCLQQYPHDNGKMLFTNCSCIAPPLLSQIPSILQNNSTDYDSETIFGGLATSGPCLVNCQHSFYMFLAIVCTLKLFGAMGRVTNFLVAVRCVEERDKAVSLGISISAHSLFAFVPAPIFFGYIMDSTCNVWGKTCTQTGNCWLYNATLLRQKLNYIAACFLFVGSVFDLIIWWKVKDINMFDDGLELLTKDDGVKDTKQGKAQDKKDNHRAVKDEKDKGKKGNKKVNARNDVSGKSKMIVDSKNDLKEDNKNLNVGTVQQEIVEKPTENISS